MARATGAARALAMVYTVFAVAAVSRAAYQIATDFERARLAYVLSAIAGAVYVVAAYGFVRDTRDSLRIALAAVLFEAVGVVGVGLLTLFDDSLFPDQTVWSLFGQGYGYVPLVLPFLGLWWLRREHARRA